MLQENSISFRAAASEPNLQISSFVSPSLRLRGHQMFKGLAAPRDGFVAVPDAPGLGIELIPDVERHFPPVARPIRMRPHTMARWSTSSSSGCYVLHRTRGVAGSIGHWHAGAILPLALADVGTLQRPHYLGRDPCLLIEQQKYPRQRSRSIGRKRPTSIHRRNSLLRPT
jgi:hypothetical protein